MHAHATPIGRKLWISAIAMAAFVVLEMAVGWQANSLALISDAGHNLTDVFALILSAWALGVATQPATRARSFGYHRVGVLAALLNAATLVLLAGYIFYEGYQRLLRPEPVDSLPMIVVAAVALVLNGVIAISLHQAGRRDVNVRSAAVHMLGDALSSVGVIGAGLAVAATGSPIWDGVVSVLIAGFIVWSSWGIVRETISVLLESTPTGLDLDEVARDIERVPGISGVHDLHVWTLGSDVRALSAHVVVDQPTVFDQHEVTRAVQQIKRRLADHHAIVHATIEAHCADCLDGTCQECDIHIAGRVHEQRASHPHEARARP